MKTSNELIQLVVIGALIIVIICIPLKNIEAVLRFSLAYLVFVYLPFLPLINKIKIGIIEKFILTNISGLSYGLIYVMFDVFFKIPLTRSIFSLVTILIICLNWIIFSKNIKI